MAGRGQVVLAGASGRRCILAGVVACLAPAVVVQDVSAARPRARPDLIVSGLTAARSTSGRGLALVVMVRNRGSAAASSSQTRLTVLRQGRQVTRKDVRAAAVPARRTRTAKPTIALPTSVARKSVRVRVCVDATRRIREIHETGNCREVTVPAPKAGGAGGTTPAAGPSPPRPTTTVPAPPTGTRPGTSGSSATPPSATIDARPSSRTRDAVATVEFREVTPPFTLECRLDQSPFAACSSPFVSSPLADGAHEFEVRPRRDDVVSGSATASWTVDTTPPVTTITAGPSSTTRSDATLSFSADEPDATFVCAVDTGDPTRCTSPHTFTDLPLGDHTLTVAAADDLGNADPTPATQAVTIASAPPHVTVSVSPGVAARGDEKTLAATVQATEGRAVKDIAWDLDDDGAADDATGATITATFGRSGVNTVTAVAVDSATESGRGTGEVAVSYPGGPAPAEDRASHYGQNAAHDGVNPGLQPLAPLSLAWSTEIGLATVPLVVGDRVFAIGVRYGQEPTGTAYALDAADGKVLWSRPIGTRPAGVGLAFADGHLFLRTEGQILQAIDPASGRLQWTTDTGGSYEQEPPLATGGNVIIATGAGATAYSGETGARVWRAPAGGEVSSPAADRSDVFFTANGFADASAIDQRTGVVQWRQGPQDLEDSAVYHQGRLWARGFPHGRVRDARTGEQLRTFDATRQPSFWLDRVLLARDATLVAEAQEDGAARWTFAAGAPITAQPLVVGSTVWIVTAAGTLIGLDALTGLELQRTTLPETGGAGGLQAASGLLAMNVGRRIVAYRGFGAAIPAPQSPAPVEPPGIPTGLPLTSGAPQLRQDSSRSGDARARTPRAPLSHRWTAPLPATVSAPVVGTDSLGVARIFVVAGSAVQAPYTRRLFALDPFDGSTVWSTEVSASGEASPAIDGDNVYLRSGGMITAYRMADGGPGFRPENGEPFSSVSLPSADGGDNALAIRDGTIYAASSSIVAIDAATGTRRFSATPGISTTSLTVDENRIYAPRTCGVSAFRRSDGAPAWSYEQCSGGGGGKDIAAHRGVTYVREIDWGGLQFTGADGTILTGFSSARSPAFTGNVAVTIDGGDVVAGDTASGLERWRTSLDEEAATNALIVDHQVFVGAGFRMYALDLLTGEVLQTIPLATGVSDPVGTETSSGPVAGHGLLLVPTGGGLVAYG